MQEQSLLEAAREFVGEYWSNFRDRAEMRNELARMRSQDVDVLAADCGLTPWEFEAMMKRGKHAADELLELIKALGLDEVQLKAANRRTFNNMTLICAECGSKPKCRRSLRDGTAGQMYGSFCDNAELLQEAKILQKKL